MEWISIGKFAKMVGLTPTTIRRMHVISELDKGRRKKWMDEVKANAVSKKDTAEADT